MSITLSSLIKMVKEDSDLLKQILSSFSCDRDKDIENFLHNRAVDFDTLSKSRTYLICDEDQINSDEFCLDQLKIYGYVSLALKVLTVPENISSSMRKKIDGLSGTIHGEKIKNFPCYLIGQLARNSNVPKESISGEFLLSVSFDQIASAISSVGGRYVMIECHEDEKLIEFYRRNDFTIISNIADNDIAMVQMIRKVC